MWYFRKKIGAIQVTRQTIKFKKKLLGLYQNMEIDLHLISHQVFLKVQIITYKMKKNRLDTIKIDRVMRI